MLGTGSFELLSILIQFQLVLIGSGQELRESDFVDLIQSTSSITSVGMGFRQDNEEVNKFTVNFKVLQTKIVIFRDYLEQLVSA